MEGDTAEGAVEKREKELREKIKEVIPCDVRNSDGFFNGEYQSRQYDIVQSFSCLEVVVDSCEAYHRGIVKLASYVKPGGYLVIIHVVGAEWYSCADVVNNSRFYILNLNKDDPMKGMEMAGEYKNDCSGTSINGNFGTSYISTLRRFIGY